MRSWGSKQEKPGRIFRAGSCGAPVRFLDPQSSLKLRKGIRNGHTRQFLRQAGAAGSPVTPLIGGTGTSGSATVSAGLLVVNVLSTASITGVSFAGTPMTLAKARSGGGYSLAQYYLAVSAGTGPIAITTTGSAAWNATNVVGLANNLLDRTHDAAGSSGTPDTGTTLTTLHAAEAVVAAFGLQYTLASWSWAGTPAFTSGAVDLTTSGVTLTEGYTVLSATGTVDAALTFSASGSYTWQGLVATYS